MSENRTVWPDSVVFDYEASSVVPVAAFYYADGAPYTGRAYGSVGPADWQGAFEDGRPHGEFKIAWGDRMSGSVWFDSGACVEGLDAGKQERRDEV